MKTPARSTNVERIATIKSRWAAGLSHQWAWLAAITLLTLVVGALIAALM